MTLTGESEPLCSRDDTMPAAFCSHCRGLDPTPSEMRMPVRDDGRWFEATHPGECDRCFKRIRIGQLIKWGESYPGARECCD